MPVWERRLQRLSQTPGRVRWLVEGLRGNALYARYLAGQMAARVGVIEVDANPSTGRILVRFDITVISAEDLESTLLAPEAVPEGLSDSEVTVASSVSGIGPSMALRGDGLIGIALAGAAATCSFLRILFLGHTLDGILRVRQLATCAAAATIVPAAALMLGSTICYMVAKRLSGAAWSRLGRSIQYEMRVMLAQRLADADLAALESESVTTLANILRSNLADVERGFDGAGDLIYISANTAVLSTAFLLLAPRLVWIPLLSLAAMTLNVRTGYHALQERYDAAGAARNLADRKLTELIDGIRTIKSFGLQRRALGEIGTTATAYRTASLAAAEFAANYPRRLELITLLGVSAVTLAAGSALAAGTMSTGTHLILMMIAGHLFFPFSQLGQPLESIHRGLAANRALYKLRTLPIENDAERCSPSLGASQVAIALKDVSFRYPSGSGPALRNVTLEVAPGSFLGIVGTSGSGKSTLAKLLLRYYEPTAGTISINGRNIRDFRRADLRRLFACVDQQSFLFEDSIEHNIAVGRKGTHPDAIRDAAQAAAISEFIESLPNGYQTEIGVRGSKLSDGQRQRLLIARALLQPAPVLILDEATSNLDLTTEQLILSKIKSQAYGRTLIVIAHRLSIIRDADMIAVLNSGEVVESGTHASLLKRDGLYRAVWQSQRSGNMHRVG